MKVLFQSRRNAFTQTGGDSIQLLKTKEYLEKLGVFVEISVDPQANIDDYDIIHVFNITGSCQTTLFQILNAKKKKKTVVLSPIYWNGSELRKVETSILASGFAMQKRLDPIFINFLMISVLRNLHLQRVLDTANFLRDVFKRNVDEDLKARIAFGQKEIQKMCLELADIILPNSASEANLLVQDFGVPSQKIVIIPNGVDIGFFNPDPTLFREMYGLDGFVLSVANLGSRKNTLALIQALIPERIPLVLIGSSDPNYMYCRLCAKVAQRGQTTFLGKIPHGSPMLASAYAAAKVHAQVSWFETPGLSSLEAGLAGGNIVVSDRGSTRDYFENYAWYCDPANVSSIRHAVLQAFYSPKKNDLKFHILNNYTWDKAAEKTLYAYHRVLNST